MSETSPVDSLEPLPSRYVVGMDLGTTNSAVAYVDTHELPWQVRVLAIPQLVAAGQVEARETLPSFHYQPATGEVSDTALDLPWNRTPLPFAVGMYARDQGALMPGRLISSAKSWLCHSGVDRRGDILPWQTAEDVDRLSPVEVSSRYLAHVRAAWNHRFPTEPLEQQDFVLTLPASFDEVARELTVEAAARAGLSRVVLIEEPQAAFYAWIDQHANGWEQRVSPGQKILICDIGGGTSDFTLIRVRAGEGGKVQFHRVAVGDHLILGGDNLDLALAHHLEQRFVTTSDSGADASLTPRQWDLLVRACRRVKEELLGEQKLERFTVHLPGSGSRLIGGGRQIEVTRAEVEQVLIDGFFPQVELSDRPHTTRAGFQEFGLPFATDAAITRHLAAFLTNHRQAGLSDEESADADSARPDLVLFNGGLFESPAIRRRVLAQIAAWFRNAADPAWHPLELTNARLDLAVARGAAYYGMVRRGVGVKITANLARSYYLGVATTGAQPQAVCILPGNAEPGQEYRLSSDHLGGKALELLVSQPVEFPLFVSSTRLADAVGQLVEIDPQWHKALPPIRTALRSRRRSDEETATVELLAKLTEIGTVDLWCAEAQGPRRWRLQFDVRSTTQTDIAAHESQAESEGVLDETTWASCQQVLDATFGTTKPALPPDSIMKNLVTAAGMERDQWPTSLLRRLAEGLLERDAGRRRTAIHEARWLNLLGYTLRPGYGLAVDDWRVSEAWKLVQGRLAHGTSAGRTESLILWRRIAGGLTAGQQRAVAEPLIVPVRALHRRLTTGQDRASETTFSQHEAAEVWRLLGSLELLPLAMKRELGRMIVDLLPKRKLESLRPALLWTLGRVGSRVPVYGPLNAVITAEVAATWLSAVMELAAVDSSALFCVTLIAQRTGDRYRDLHATRREEVLRWLALHDAPEHYQQLVREGGQLAAAERERAFGESLPRGLRLRV
jgi:molecular chaperone DnaK (HSP70)